MLILDFLAVAQVYPLSEWLHLRHQGTRAAKTMSVFAMAICFGILFPFDFPQIFFRRNHALKTGQTKNVRGKN
jgi:hypothetical protein